MFSADYIYLLCGLYLTLCMGYIFIFSVDHINLLCVLPLRGGGELKKSPCTIFIFGVDHIYLLCLLAYI